MNQQVPEKQISLLESLRKRQQNEVNMECVFQERSQDMLQLLSFSGFVYADNNTETGSERKSSQVDKISLVHGKKRWSRWIPKSLPTICSQILVLEKKNSTCSSQKTADQACLRTMDLYSCISQNLTV